MPVGVVTSTAVKSAPAVTPTDPQARYFLAGITERGPVGVAVRCRSLAEFTAAFGGQVPYSPLVDHLRVFWAEGGYEAVVARLVGPAAVKATASLDSGKLVVTARNPGAFASTWTAGYTAASKTLTITTDTGTETWTGDDLAGLLAAAAASPTVTVTSSGSLPTANVAAVTLTGGSDDRTSITASVATAALAAFGDALGAGAVALPGWSATQVGAALITHAKATRRIALLAGARTDTLTAFQTAVATLRPQDADGCAGAFWPWVMTPGGAVVSPESAVAGVRARAIRAAGPWLPPAGGNGRLGYVAAVDQAATRGEVNTAHDEYAVSVITTIAGGPRLYGWRALAPASADLRYLSYRDTLNLIRVAVEEVLEPYVYAPLTAALAQNAVGSIIGALKPLIDGGGLFPLIDADGTRLDDGYRVDVTTTVGPGGEGVLRPVVAVRVAPAAELIQVPITKVAVGAALA